MFRVPPCQIKALIAGGFVRPELDPQGLQDYLTFQFCLEEKTLFHGVRTLPPGHAVVVHPAMQRAGSPTMTRRLRGLWESRGRPSPTEPLFVSPRGARLDYSNLYKRIGAPDVESVQLGDGGQGLWIPTPHEVTYIDRTGATRTAQSRTAGPTLVWQAGAVMYRLEGNLTRDQATAIAASVHP